MGRKSRTAPVNVVAAWERRCWHLEQMLAQERAQRVRVEAHAQAARREIDTVYQLVREFRPTRLTEPQRRAARDIA